MTTTADLPRGWMTLSLGDLFDFSNGVNADKTAYGSGVPFANVLEVITHEALTDQWIPGRIELSSAQIARYRVRRGDVLFNRTSETQDEVGLASVYVGNAATVFGGFVFRGRPKTSLLDTAYSEFALRAHTVRQQIVARGQGGVRANIGQRDLSAVRVVIPPLVEQRRIAEVLGDLGRQITVLERTLAKKRAIQRAVMQDLVTGRVRLPGFTQGWEHATWGELTKDCVSGATPLRSRADFWGGEIPWVTSSELEYGTITRIPQAITTRGLEAARLTVWPAGTFLMAITGLEAAGTRGSCGRLGLPATTNQSCMAIIPNDRLLSEFLYYFYLLRGDELALRYCQGTKQQSYTARVVKSLPIYLPTDIKEQLAIVELLAALDVEIDALCSYLGKWKSVKQGMMQRLLTGRTRLPGMEEATT